MSENTLSILDGDKTLPVDFDGSCDPAQLPEVTFGSLSQLPCGSNDSTNTTGDGGYISPVRARTMKEYDQQLAELKKENFSLKLRIYFLEERVQKQFNGDGEALFKTTEPKNIELKVEVESLKKELCEKQDLLKKASTALESVTAQHEVDLKNVREFARQEALREAQQQREILELEIVQLKEQLIQKDQDVTQQKLELEEMRQKVKELMAIKGHLEAEVKVSQRRRRELETELDGGLLDDDGGKGSNKRSENDLEDRDSLIKQLQNVVKTKELIIEQLEEEKKEAVKEISKVLEAEIKKRDDELQALRQQLCANKSSHDTAVSASDSEIDFISEAGMLTDELKDKSKMIMKGETNSQDQEAEARSLAERFAELEKQHQKCEENMLKRNKVIQGLAKVLYERDAEILSLSSQVEELTKEVEKLKGELHQEKVHEYQELESHHSQLLARDDRITELEAALRENELEKQRLEKSIMRREAEVRQLTQQLDKADVVISQKDDMLQDLRETLQQEKQKNFAVVGSLEKHYQTLMDDQQRQIESQEKLLQRMTKSLQDKDKQLEGMLQAQRAVGDKSSKDVLIDSLKTQLADKEKELEEHISNHYKSLDAKDAEIRQLKMSLKERDHDISKANQMLLVTEETIDSLESEAKEKNAMIKQLAMTLKAQERALEEAAVSHERTVAEKNALLEKLQKSLSVKEKHLQNAVGSSPSSGSAMVTQLQNQTREKDKVIEELVAEHGRATDTHDKAVQDLLHKLRQRDDQVKDMERVHQDELGQLSREIQRLQADLNKRDFLIRSLESNTAWMESQQKEMLDKLRTALNEKDKTIEALVESGREKDALFRKLQESIIMTRTTNNTDQTRSLQELSDQTTHLKGDLLNKEALISRLRAEVDHLGAKSSQMSNVGLNDVQVHQVRMKELMAAGDTTCPSCKQLQSQVDQLRLQLDRTVLPQRTQTLGGSTSQQVNGEQSYRCQADESVASGRPKSDMSSGTERPYCDTYGSTGVELSASRLQQHVLMLQKQLDESHQLNKLLQHHLQQTITANRSPMGIDQGPVGGAKSGGRDGVNHAWGGARPSGVSGGDQSANGSLPLCTSYLPSYMDLPDPSVDLREESDSLSAMKPEQLEQLVRSLRRQLADALMPRNGDSDDGGGGCQEALRGTSCNGSPDQRTYGSGAACGSVITELEQQLQQLKTTILVQNDLEQRDAELKLLTSQAVCSQSGCQTRKLQKQVAKLSVQLQHAEYLNQLLKKQLELNADATRNSSDPQLITNMANEIDRLKQEMAIARLSANTESDNTDQRELDLPCQASADGTTPGADPKTIEKQIAAVKAELASVKKQNATLQATLASTEATVRIQAERMKSYRSQLEEAGILPKTPVRSHSESNLSLISGRRSPLKQARSVGELSASSLPGVDLAKLTGYGQGNDVDQLKREIAELKSSLVRYDRALAGLRCAARSASAGSSESSGGSAKRSSTSHIPVATTRLRTISASSTSTTHSTTAMPSSAAAQQLQELEHEVDDLRRQLTERGQTIVELKRSVSELKRKRLATAETGRHDSSCQTMQAELDLEKKLQKLEDDYAAERQLLMRQLAESRQLCESLQRRLDELSVFLEEFLHQNDEGEVDMIDVTPTRVTNFKALLSDTRHLASDLSLLMENASEESLAIESAVPPPSDDPATSIALQKKYELAQQEIKHLKEQLELYSQHQDTAAMNKLQEENNELQTSAAKSNEINVELEAKVECLQNDLFTERERYMQVDDELQTAQSQLTDLRRSTELLRRQLTEADQLRAQSEKTIADLRSEREELMRKIEDDKRNMEELEKQIERLQCQLKNSNVKEWSHDEQRMGNTRQEFSLEMAPTRQTSNQLQNGSIVNMEDDFTDLPQRQSFRELPHHSTSMESVERHRHGTDETDLYHHKNTTLSSPDMTREMLTSYDLLDENLLRRAGLASYGRGPHPSGDHETIARRGSSSHGADAYRNRLPHDAHERLENELSHGIVFSMPDMHKELDGHVLDPIRMQLQMAEELNSTIQNIYRRVSEHETSLSVGIQTSPSVGAKSSQTSSSTSGPLPLDLAAHIEEVRALRLKLEETIVKNGRLREVLEKQLEAARKEGREAYIQVQQDLQAEIDSTNKQLQARTRQLNNVTQELVAKDRSLKEANQKVSQLQAVVRDRDDELRLLRKTAARLEANVSRLQEELRENADLNKTLKRELDLYDKFTPQQSQGKGRRTPIDFDPNISTLMEEMRQLRKQLERTIDNNNILRQKLEELIAQCTDDSQTKHNVNNTSFSFYSAKTDASRPLNGSPSPRDAGRESSQLSGNSLQGQSLQSNQSPSADTMRYNITDPSRPPSVTSVRVSSDLRTLYAVGAIDDYELLKKQLAETKPIISSVQSLLTGSVDGSLRRQLSSSLQNLSSLVNKQERLVSMFWLTQLPRNYQYEESVDVNLIKENQQLRQQIALVRRKYIKAKEIGLSAAQHLAAQNKLKQNTEEEVIQQLKKTHAVLKKARSNLAEKLNQPKANGRDADTL